MKKKYIHIILILLVMVILTVQLVALTSPDSLTVNIKGVVQPEYLGFTQINGIKYCNLENLATLFRAVIKDERTDNRIYLNIYDEQFIFLTNSLYFTFKNTSQKLNYPLINYGGSFYLPLDFATQTLPGLFKDKVSWTGRAFTIAPPDDNTIRTIVIDPGHGGKDPGAVGRTLNAYEKNINLGVALKLKAILEKEMKVKVLLTHSEDKFVSLQERTKFANDSRADLFISIHTNASRDRSSRGTEMYYLSTAKTTEARAVEALENSVVEKYEGGLEATRKYDDLALILSDIMQAENLEQSSNLAMKLQMNICAGTKSANRGLRQANFYVLRGAFMPSVLIEMGFISNAVEESFLVNQQYQERMARTIFEGIKSFKYRYDRIRSS